MSSIRKMAALDAEASKGPWEPHTGLDYSCVMRGDEATDDGIQTGCEADSNFIAASKGFAPRVLAALERKIARWERDDYRDADPLQLADELRALLDTDLPQQPPEVKP